MTAIQPRLCALWPRLFFAALLGAFLTGCSWETSRTEGPAPRSAAQHLVMISIDGLVPDYYTAPETLGIEAPHLSMLMASGAHASAVEGVYPSVTYPSHTTLVTGVLPSTHGIVQNVLFEPPTGPQTKAWYWFADGIEVDTLWTVAARAGLVTAAVAWPATAGAAIDYNVPEIWDPGGRSSQRARERSTAGIFEEAFGSEGQHGIGTDEERTRLGEAIIKRHEPHLMLIHLFELDSTHHRFGPRTPEAIRELERQDGYVGRIIQATREAGTFDQTAFVVVSDHGFARIDRTFEPNVVLAREGLISLGADGVAHDWKAASWPAGGSCAIVLRSPSDAGTAAKVEEIFRRVLRQTPSPLRDILDRKTLDRLGAVPQAALMLEAAEGYAFDQRSTGPAIHDSGDDHRGEHGYLPTQPAMHSALIAYGAGVQAGANAPLVRMIDIAPTAAALLGLRLQTAQGEPLVDFLEATAGPEAAKRPGPR
jgi:predicted AlkP superfamily pyrophosphatase or phosphodiesterase